VEQLKERMAGLRAENERYRDENRAQEFEQKITVSLDRLACSHVTPEQSLVSCRKESHVRGAVPRVLDRQPDSCCAIHLSSPLQGCSVNHPLARGALNPPIIVVK
jgi:hypothetical protein